MSRGLFALAVLAGLLGAAVVAVSGSAHDYRGPVADTFVTAAAPNRSFGTWTRLGVDRRPDTKTFVRFDVGSVGDVRRATLGFYAFNGSPAGFQVRSLGDSWSESTTYRNAPPVGPVIAASGPIDDDWTYVDVTPYVNAARDHGDRYVNFGVTTTGNALIFGSRESGATAPRLYILERSAPRDTTAPVVTLVQPGDGSSTSDSTPTFSGLAGTATGDLPAVTVKIYRGTSTAGTLVQTLTAARSPSGGWSTDAAPLADGVYTARAQQSDAAGNTGQSTANTFTVDANAPAPTLATPANGSSTSDTTPTYSGTAGTAAGDSPTVTVKVYAGTTASGSPVQTLTATRNASGAWTVDGAPPLADGTYTARAQQSDSAGNVGQSNANTFTVDATAPAPTLATPANGSSTNDTTPTYSGTAGTAAGDSPTVTVKVYAGPAATGAPVQTLTATRNASGAWSVDGAPPLADGTYTAQAEQTDATGNTGQSNANTFTVDATAPAPTLATPANGSSTTDATPTYSGTGGTAPGDAAAVTVKVYAGSTASGAPVQTLTAPVDASGSWTVDGSPALADGTYTARAEQTDAAGNTGQSNANTFTVDTTTPAPTLATPANGSTTSDATPLYAGTAGTALGDSPTVTVNVYAGPSASGSPIQTLTAARDASGNWSVEGVSPLAEGTYTARAEQTDAAGHTGQSSANTFTVRSYRSVVLANNPVAYWRLGELPPATIAQDETANDLDGVYKNGVLLGLPGALPNDPNTSAGFDGLDDRVDMGDASLLDFGTDDFSLEAWIKTTVNGDEVIMSKHQGSGRLWRLMVTADAGFAGRVKFRIFDGTSGRNAYGPALRVDDGQWHHVVTTVDRDTGVTVYVDRIAATTLMVNAGNLDNTAPFLLGAASGNTSFSGQIDEAAVYRSLLTEADVRARYGSARPPAPPTGGSAYRNAVLLSGPIGYWRLGETPAAASAQDETAFDHPGLYVGGVTRGVPGALVSDPDTAARFDGVDDKVSVGDPPDGFFDFGTSDFSVESWVKTTSNADEVIVSKYEATTTLWRLIVTADAGFEGRAKLRIYDGTVSRNGYGPNIRVDDGNWHHVVATIDRDLGITVYVDGTPNFNPGTTLGNLANGAELAIGKASSNPFFNGDIDEVALYRRVLTAGEVSSHKNIGRPAPPPPPGPPTLLAAGDIADCGSSGDEATAAILTANPDAKVATLGDNAYPDGTAAQFSGCYDPSWGVAKPRTYPSVGNHEYNTPGAAGYFGYFGPAAGDPSKGYYSYELGTWHVVVLNSECAFVPGGCGVGSPQETWLRSDLAAHPTGCTLAYTHHPRFSSGDDHGNDPAMQPFWQALSDYGAEVVLAGHDHIYERFAPQSATGGADPLGIRQFVVGTGGASHDTATVPKPSSEVIDTGTYGVLKLTLNAASYSWDFLPVAGGTFTDTGSTICH